MPRPEERTRSEWAKIWKSRVQLACRKHKKKVLDWADKVVQEYTGDFKDDADTGESYRQVCQVIMSVEETIQPHLFFQNPKMLANAKRKKSAWENRKDLVEEMVNHQYASIKESGYGIELENELALLDARILGYGATETRYEVEGEFLEEPEEEDSGMIEKMKEFMTGEMKPPKRTPVISKEKGQTTEFVSALELVLDPTAKHITKQKYYIRLKDFSEDDLKNSRYDQEKVKILKPTILYNDEIRSMSDEERKKYAEENPDYKGFKGFEIHDLENKVVHTMIEGLDEFIEYETPELTREGGPVSFLWFIDSPGDAYPQPPLKYYRKRALEFSYIYSSVSEQIDKFLPRVFVNKDVLDKPEQIKLQHGQLGTLVGVRGPAGNAASVFAPSVNPDLFKYLAMIKDLLNLESGSNEYELAAADSGSQKTTATEINTVKSGTTSRRFKPKKRVAGFIRNQVHIIWQVTRDNAPLDHFIKVLGEEDAQDWWNDPETGKAAWESPDAIEDYWFDFDVDSVAPVDTEKRQAENQKKLETVLNPALRDALAMEQKTLLVGPIFETYAHDNLGVRDISKILVDQQILSADEEHSLWMRGQYPPISPDELNNPQKLMEHFQKHDAYVKSPGFAALPPEMQEPGLEHRDSYLVHVQRLQAQQGQKPARAPQQAKPQMAGVA